MILNRLTQGIIFNEKSFTDVICGTNKKKKTTFLFDNVVIHKSSAHKSLVEKRSNIDYTRLDEIRFSRSDIFDVEDLQSKSSDGKTKAKGTKC